MKKNIAFAIAATLTISAALPSLNTAAATKIYTYDELLDEVGTFTINISGNRATHITIAEDTQDNLITYYDLTVEEDGTYTFVLDSCEYDNENTVKNSDYTSSYTVTVSDAKDTRCSYTLEGILVPDPGFSTDVTASSYTWNVVSTEADSRSTNADITSATLIDGVYTGSATVQLNYLNFTFGDVDGDEAVSIQDAYLALQYYANHAAGTSWSFVKGGVTKQSEDAAFAAADVDLDDEVSITDASKILNYYANGAAGLEQSWD